MTSANENAVIGQCVFAAFGELLDEVVAVDVANLNICEQTRNEFLKTLYEAFPIEGIDAALQGEQSEITIGQLNELIARMESIKQDLKQLQEIQESNAVSKTRLDTYQQYLLDHPGLESVLYSEEPIREHENNWITPSEVRDAFLNMNVGRSYTADVDLNLFSKPIDYCYVAELSKVDLMETSVVIDEDANYAESVDPRVNLVRHVRLLQDDLRIAANCKQAIPAKEVQSYVESRYGNFLSNAREHLFSAGKVIWTNVRFLESAGFQVVHDKKQNQLDIYTTHGKVAI